MIRALRNKIDNEAINNDRAISNRIRDMEFMSLYQYGNQEIKPVEPKDAVGVFKMTQYINGIERTLTDLTVDLDNEVNKVIAKIASSPDELLNKPINIPPVRVIPSNKTGVVGSGINDANNTITRLVADWNSFVNFLNSFKKNLSQKDYIELHDELNNLIPNIEKNINNILIIDANEGNQRYNYEKRVLETLEERILSKNLSKITLQDMDRGSDELQGDIRTLNTLARTIKGSKTRVQEDVDDYNLGIQVEQNALEQEIDTLNDKIIAWQKDEKKVNNLKRVPAKNTHPDYTNLKDKRDELKKLKVSNKTMLLSVPYIKQEKEFENVRKKLMKGRGQMLKSAIHFNHDDNDLHKFYSV